MGRGCHDCVRCFLVVTNTITMLAGLAIVGFGAYVIIMANKEPPKIPDNAAAMRDLIKMASYVMFGVGSATFLISISGCFGSMFTARCLLVLYAFFMLVLAAAQIGAAIMFLADKVKDYAVDTAGKELEQLENELLHVIEVAGQCCGPHGPESYESNYVPITCCATYDPANPGNGYCPISEAFDEGCVTVVGEIVDHLKIGAGCGFLGVAVFELLNMIAAIYICFRPYDPVQLVTQIIR